MSRQQVSALFEVEMAIVPLIFQMRMRTKRVPISMRMRTKKVPRSHHQPPPLSLPTLQWWHRWNLLHLHLVHLYPIHLHPVHLHPIQKRKNRTSSHPFWVDRRRQSPSIMKTRPAALSVRPLLVVCSRRDGQFLHELRVVAPSRAVARGSSAPPACPPHTTSVHTMMCLASS